MVTLAAWVRHHRPMLTPEAIAASKDSITTLVVGANRGIGYELARQAKERGQKVIATTRTPSEELNGLGVRVVEGVDVTKDDDVRHLDDSLEGVHLDRLILRICQLLNILDQKRTILWNVDGRFFLTHGCSPLKSPSFVGRRNIAVSRHLK